MKNLGKNVAFIPVRGGSKSIPLKNIKKINGRPLIYWVLDAATGCRYLDTIVVSTDSNEIKEIVEAYGHDKILIVGRSEVVSTDTASTESVMMEFSSEFEFDRFVLIQATSPLLESRDLDKGFELIESKQADSVLSVVEQKRFIWSESESGDVPLNYDYKARPRRQDFQGYLVENGAFYITDKTSFERTSCRISGKIKTIKMTESSYFEIDEPEDWIIVEALLKKRHGRIASQVKNIKCVLTDCDGVLTDAGMYYSEFGDELKKFNTRDGMGFKRLKENGIITGIVTGENVDLVRRRGEKLKVDELHLGIKNKLQVIDEICRKYNLNRDEIAYIGDDTNDIEVLENVGLSFTVSNAADYIKEVAQVTLKSRGGEGAYREVVDYILGNEVL